MQRHDVALTLIPHCINVMSLLELVLLFDPLSCLCPDCFQHQRHVGFILTAVVVILKLVKGTFYSQLQTDIIFLRQKFPISKRRSFKRTIRETLKEKIGQSDQYLVILCMFLKTN